MVNIVIPMAGLGSRFADAGYVKPKPFIDVLGKPMIVQVLDNLKYKDAKYILIARKEHLEQEADVVKEIEARGNVIFVPIDMLTEGSVCTVLFARKLINNDTPMMIANSDQIVDIDIADYINDCKQRGLDGSILTFKEPEKDPKWSYALPDEDGFIIDVKEKVAISDIATVGIYLFSKGADYVNYALDMIVRNDRVKNEFYNAPVYNYAVKDGKKIGHYLIKQEQMHGTGTPADLDSYIELLQKQLPI